MKKSLLNYAVGALFACSGIFFGCALDATSSDSSLGLLAVMGAGNSSSSTVTPTPTPTPSPSPASGTNATGVMESPTAELPVNATVNIVKNEGWLNSAYIIFEQISGATYTVKVDGTEIDSALIRYYDTYTYYENADNADQTTWTQHTLQNVVRADALGLAAGNHTLSVCANGTNGSTEFSSAVCGVVDHNRSGFAFTSSKVPGAYKTDGTLKDNAIVIYVTGATAKTVSYTAVKGTNSTKDAIYTGLQNILSEASLKNLTVPLDIRIIGTITKNQMDSLGSSAEGVQIKTTSENGVTVEGVGHDAAVYGFGFLIRNAKYTELCNLGVFNFMDDGISVDTDNSYLWIHNNDISYGAVGSDSDQAKGDGSLDFKKSTYSTLSYNHFWDSGKCNLLDASAGSSGSNYLSYHHNWYDHSDSRHPRIRNATAVHVYNNYYDGNAKYGVGVTSGSSAFVEGNYFRNANDPMMSAAQGTDAQGSGTFSGEDGGVIKAYNNFFTGNSNYASAGGATSTSGMKLHYVTNKYDYTNGVAVTEPETHTETVGTSNSDGTYTLYSWTYGNEFPSFITKNDVTDKTGYYQVSKGKTAFTLTVPSNASKVVITAKSASSGVTSATLKVAGVSQTVTDDNYPEYEFDVSSLSSTSLAVVAGSEGSINFKSIKVIAPTAWSTTYTTGISLSDIDAYEVDSRSATVPATVVTKQGGTTYSNFDTSLGDSGMGVTIAVTNPTQAKSDVMKYAGRHNPDFAYSFDNATEDKNYGVISELKTLVVNYTGGLTAIQGTSSSSGNSGSGSESGETGGESSGETGGTTGGESGGNETAVTSASLTFNSSSSLSPVSSGITFTLAKGTAEAGSKDYFPSTGKVKILKMEGTTTVSFTSPGTTSDSYTMTINYITKNSGDGALNLTPNGVSASEITLAGGGSLGSSSSMTGTTASVTANISGGTSYVISRKSTESYIASIVITASN